MLSAVVNVGSSCARSWPLRTMSPTDTAIVLTIDVLSGWTTSSFVMEMTFPDATAILSIEITANRKNMNATSKLTMSVVLRAARLAGIAAKAIDGE